LSGVRPAVWLHGHRGGAGPAPSPTHGPSPTAAVAPRAPEASTRPARAPERPQQLISARTQPDPGLVHGAFAGRVLNFSTGAGVSGAQVTFAAPGGSQTVSTDGQGSFAFEPPASGVYRL